MTVSVAVLKELMAAGLDGEALLAACVRIANAEQLERPVDVAAERRRAADRERKRAMRLRNSAESAEIAEQNVPPFSPPSLSPTPPIPSPPISPPKNPHGARGTRLTAQWQPSQAELDFALDSGWTREFVEMEICKFRDYWIAQPGQKGVKVDWPATWRNWIRRNLPSHHHGPPKRQENYREIGERLLKEMRDERSEIEIDNRVVDLFPTVRR
jgi:hypothetical protein